MEELHKQNPQEPRAPYEDDSPNWNATTKLLVGITLVAILAGIFMQLRPILTPVSMAIVISYLLFPLVEWLSERTKLSWRGAANLTFVILLLLLFGSMTASGVALFNQFLNLLDIIEVFLNDLPTLVEDFINNQPVITIPFIGYTIDFSEYIRSLNIDLLAIADQAISFFQPMLGQAGNILTTVATSAVSVLGWGGFILAVAYMITGEARQGRKFLKRELEGLTYDIGRMTREVSYIWNTFLRGQMLVFTTASTTMFILMSILGVRYAFGLAILSGFARFVPYVGQLFSTIINALVAFFLAEGNYLGLDPLPYMILVVVLAFLHDQTYDSLVIPKLIGHVLGVHPALVLITALVLTSWIGVLGIILAAPILASLQLVASYVIRKMMDQDPWPDEEVVPPTFVELMRSTLKDVFVVFNKIKDFVTGFIQKRIKRNNKK